MDINDRLNPDDARPDAPSQRQVKQLLKYKTLVKQLRLQLIQSMRIPMTEEIIASLVHEVSNPLYAIQLAVSHALTDIEPERKAQLLQGVLEQVEHIADLTKKLRNFYRSPQGVQKSVEIRSFLGEALSFLDPYLKRKHIKISTKIEGAPVFIEADSNRLKLAVFSVFKISIDAMKGAERKELEVRVMDGENQVVVEISTSGYSWPKEAVDDISDSFSVKGEVLESRIELSIWRQIIENYGGKVQIQSSSGIGTKFQMYLPRQAAPCLPS